jgi:hypothetical protein
MLNRALVVTYGLATLACVGACGGSSTSTDATVTTTTPVNTKITYTATLVGSAERPNPATTSATGQFTGTLDTVTKQFTWVVTFSGLVANSTLSHIHGPGTVDQAVNPVLDFSKVGSPVFTPGATAGSYAGTVTLNTATAITATVSGDSLLKLMNAGLTYVNVHSTTFPGGEIRGQISKK